MHEITQNILLLYILLVIVDTKNIYVQNYFIFKYKFNVYKYKIRSLIFKHTEIYIFEIQRILNNNIKMEHFIVLHIRYIYCDCLK